MTDIGIFIFGCCVFGVAITATLTLVIGPSRPEIKPRETLPLSHRGDSISEDSSNPVLPRIDGELRNG